MPTFGEPRAVEQAAADRPDDARSRPTRSVRGELLPADEAPAATPAGALPARHCDLGA